MALQVNGKPVQTNNEGFLIDSSDWNDLVCEALSNAHSIELTDNHWEVLRLLRDYCDQGNEPPSMRHLSKEIKNNLGEKKARSIYLMRLFGSSPAKMAARLAGLPRPKNCL